MNKRIVGEYLEQIGLSWTIATGSSQKIYNNTFVQKLVKEGQQEAAQSVLEAILFTQTTFYIEQPEKFKQAFGLKEGVGEIPNTVLTEIAFTMGRENEVALQAFQRNPMRNFTVPRTEEEVEFTERINPGYRVKRVFNPEEAERENVNIMLWWILRTFESEQAEYVRKQLLAGILNRTIEEYGKMKK